MSDIAPQWSEPTSLSTDRNDRPDDEIIMLPVSLSVAVLAVLNDEPVILLQQRPGDRSGPRSRGMRLPAAPAETLRNGGTDQSLRNWGAGELGLSIGHVEQLTAISGNGPGANGALSVCYLALARAETSSPPAGFHWQPWYGYLPWEDWRQGPPAIIEREILPRLGAASTAGAADSVAAGRSAPTLAEISFATQAANWNEDLVSERFEMLAEAGLIVGGVAGPTSSQATELPPLEESDQRVLAAAIARLRTRLRDRPVIFGLMGDAFTLFDLQRTVEAVLGPHLHKQNFRRLVEATGMIEPTGSVRTQTGGRPAKLFRVRTDGASERRSSGLRVRARG